MIRKTISILILLMMWIHVSSQYYLVNTGDWSNSDNWSLENCWGDGTIDGSVPDDNDAVIICSGNTIILDGDITVASAIIKNNGTINILGNKDLKIEGNLTQYFDGSGTITSADDASNVELKKSNKIFKSTANITIQPKINFKEDDYFVSNFGIVTLEYSGVSTQGELDSEKKQLLDKRIRLYS